MPKIRAEKGPPTGIMRALLRAPIWLYKARLGFLLGDRFLMITHTGRKSGLPRQTVVEVVDHDRALDTYIVASGWGKGADWYQNILKSPHVIVHAGSRCFETDAVHLTVDQAAQTLTAYAERNPYAFKKLTEFMLGERASADVEGAKKLAEHAPLVALRAP